MSSIRISATFAILCVAVFLFQGTQARGVPTKLRTHHFQHHHYGGGHSKDKSQKEVPIFVAHRGDKAHIPEHTIPAYDFAMLENVDFVEPDLCLTRDQVLVCHHDITLRSGTDVSSRLEFASLMRQNITLFLDGKNVTILNDWLISDFTLAQLKTLKVNQANTGVRPQYFNGYFTIPTFQEYIKAVHKDTWRRKQLKPNDTFVMGMIPELKHPDYHNELFHTDHFMEDIFLSDLANNGYMNDSCKYEGNDIPCSPLIVQCFYMNTIEYLSENTDLSLLILLDMQTLRYLTHDGMTELVNKTDYVGMWKELLFTGTELEANTTGTVYDPEEIGRMGGFIEPLEMASYVHGLGLKLAIYTIYQSDEPSKRGCARECVDDSKEIELNYYFDQGVDLFFVEGICESLRIRDEYFGYAGVGGNNSSKVGNGAERQVPPVLLPAIFTTMLLKFLL